MSIELGPRRGGEVGDELVGKMEVYFYCAMRSRVRGAQVVGLFTQVVPASDLPW
jgi:hypothetical protein